jgi:hypothetical protein
MSIKAYEPNIAICLVHDETAIAHLNEKELALFNQFIVADPVDYTVQGKKQYQRMKLCALKYSPFDNTLYIDVDTLWFPKKKISQLISSFQKFDFFIGKNGEYDPTTKRKIANGYTFWGDPATISRYFNLKNPMPQTISGVFWFKKTAFTEKVFSRALEIFNDPMAPSVKWANGKADEYCFNVSLSELNYRQANTHIVYFDKCNGILGREQMYNNFWGIAAGGNKLIQQVRNLYNELVDALHEVFNLGVKRMHVDKSVVIKERRNF